MIILLSNDDGIDSDGLSALAQHLAPLGQIWTVAPAQVQNAMSRALTLHRPLRITQQGPRLFAVDGTPSDCVNIAIHGILPEAPALVVSGINKGPNLGDDITYSGTVAAAFEAAIHGIPALAVSLACRRDFRFDPAAAFTARLAAAVLQQGMLPRTLLNVNVPDTRGAPVSQHAITRQGRCRYDHTPVECLDPRGGRFCWIGGSDVAFEDIPGSDADAVQRNLVSITPITTDVTHEAALKTLTTMRLAP